MTNDNFDSALRICAVDNAFDGKRDVPRAQHERLFELLWLRQHIELQIDEEKKQFLSDFLNLF